jgi:serine/threonine protein kinase/tetratricopeptide (TPR) repeat protein
MNQQYEKFEVIGKGRHSVIYEGHDHGPLNRSVAIKELAAPFRDDPRRVASFLNEAGFLANLDYEHLLKVYAVVQDSNLVITELLEGSLDQLASERGPMTSDRVRSVIQQVLKALNYLHRRNILYGRIRPSKLLFTDRGKVKLGGFERIENGLIPRPEVEKYVAPELLSTDFGPVGPAMDFYCLAFSALELLLGKKFDEVFPVITGDKEMSDVGWLRWHSSPEPLPPVKKLVPGIAADVAAALDSMLKKNVAQRPQTAVEAMQLLNDVDSIPVIDGVEQSIFMDSGRRKRADVQKVRANTASVEATAPAKPVAAPQSPKTRSQSTPAGSRSAKKSSLLPVLLLVLFAGALGGGGWWTWTKDPFGWFKGANGKADPPPKEIAKETPKGEGSSTDPVPEIPPPPQPVAVEFRFSPDITVPVSIAENGEALQPDSNGKWLLLPGTHKLAFEAGDYRATGEFNVSPSANRFEVALQAMEKPVTHISLPIQIDPPDAVLQLNGSAIALSDGAANISLELAAVNFPLKIEITRDGYEAVSSDFDRPDDLANIPALRFALRPYLKVQPSESTATLAGQPLEKTEHGFLLPRRDGPYALSIACEGYVPFDQETSFDLLKSWQFSIELLNDLDHVFRLGRKALDEQQYETAIGHFSEVLGKDADRYMTACLFRAQSFLGRNAGEDDVASARGDLTTFIESTVETIADGDRALAHLLRARLDRETSFEAAIADYQRSVDLNDLPEVRIELVDYLLDRARSESDAGNIDVALDHVGQAIKVLPEHARAFAVRGYILRDHKAEFEKAIRDFEKARELKFDPEHEMLMAIGDTWFANGEKTGQSRKFEDAAGHFDQASSQFERITRNSRLPEDIRGTAKAKYLASVRYIGDCHRGVKDYDKAIEVYTQVIQESGESDVAAFASRGNCHKFLNDLASAEKDLAKAIEIDGSYDLAHVYMAQVMIKWGDDLAAERVQADASEQDRLKRDSIARYQQAVRQIEPLIERDPQARYFDLMIAACQQLNLADPTEANAARLREWTEKYDSFRK